MQSCAVTLTQAANQEASTHPGGLTHERWYSPMSEAVKKPNTVSFDVYALECERLRVLREEGYHHEQTTTEALLRRTPPPTLEVWALNEALSEHKRQMEKTSAVISGFDAANARLVFSWGAACGALFVIVVMHLLG